MSRRLWEKTDQALAALAAETGREQSEETRRPSARALVTYMIDLPAQARREQDALRSEIQKFAGALPVRSLDPASIVHSSWGNRHASSFDSAEYFALKEEIRSAGGNVQAIKVRPIKSASPDALLPGSTPPEQGGPIYEVVYGHRRHRACLELGLPVLALIEDVPDADLFAQMDRENRYRENLSPWEQGFMYLKALEAGLFPSMRQLATAVGHDPATVSRAMSLAQLPKEVVNAFRSPTDLQYRWAKPLGDAIKKDRKGVLRRAERLRGHAHEMSPTSIFEEILGVRANAPATTECETATLCHGGKRIGEVVRDAHQRTVVRFHRALTVPEHSEVIHAIQKVFKKR